MKNSLPGLASPIVPNPTQSVGVGMRLQADRDMQSTSGTALDDFLATLGHVSVPNSPKINVSALSATRTTQSTSGSAMTVLGVKHSAATVAAIGRDEKAPMLQKCETDVKADSAGEVSAQVPLVPAAILRRPDAFQVGPFDVAAEPAKAATLLSPAPKVKPLASHPAQAKAAARQDADADPSVAGQDAMVPQSRPDLPPVVTSFATATGTDVATHVAGNPGPSVTLPHSVGAASHEPRQIKAQTAPVAASASTTSGAVSPASSNNDIVSTKHMLSMMASANNEAVSMPVVPIVAVAPQPDPLALSAGATISTANLLEVRADSSVQVATPQVAPALISIATRTDGNHEMTVSLNPRDLGQVEVHLVRNSDGTTAVTITASRPDVLQELSQNVHHLHAALDAANIPTDGRVMTFMTAATASDPGRNDMAARDGSTGRDSTENSSQNPGQGRAGQQEQPRHTAQDATDDNSPYRPMAAAGSRRNWQFSGLNITA